MLPDPPPGLPDAPRAFYDALRAGGPPPALEVDFGDSGIGVTFPGGIGAQVSRRAAVVFAGDEAAHFADPGFPEAAAAWLSDHLRGP